jgi:hypothetical protein
MCFKVRKKNIYVGLIIYDVIDLMNLKILF